MRTIPVAEAKAHLSALLAAVEEGEEVAVTRRGRIIARLVPDTPRNAADVFRPCWAEGGIDMEASPDAAPEPLPGWD